MLANRMRAVIGKVVDEDQMCAVPGRRMTDNLMLLRDLIGDCLGRKQKCMVLAMDFEKAFDSVTLLC